jgi:hypothetical protein
MSSSDRQKNFRQRRKQEGLVDIRTEIPTSLRDKLKQFADAKDSNMKTEIQIAIKNHVKEMFPN